MEHAGKSVHRNVHWNETIRRLKKRVCGEEDLDSEFMELLRNGKALDDEEKWFQTGVFDSEVTPLLLLSER